jgi:hypothetical protein
MQAKLRPFGAAAVAAVLLTFSYAALAQEKKATTPAPKAPAAASVCKGLNQAACAAKGTDCQWITPKKGKQKPYCRKKAAPKKKTK